MTHLRVLCVAFLLAAQGTVSVADDRPERPSFLVILCDDLGYGDLGCYGHPSIRTPHLDQLAADGLRLTDCYSASPLCSPARAGLLTGRTPSRAGIYSWIAPGNPMQLRKEEMTISGLLKGAGYATCHSGKWHLNGHFSDARHTQPGDHGFDHWFATQNNAAPSHENPRNFVRNGEPVGELEGYSCQLVADEAIAWLTKHRQAQPQQPFFLYVCFHEPHEPIASPAELVENYPDATQQGEALYYANVENMDRAVGRLMQTLSELQLDESTLVFFSSDNGPETLNRYRNAWRSHGSPGPLRGMKLHVYDGGIRVPGIIRWTGRIRPGQESDTPVCSLDLLPTFCELAGVSPDRNRELDGTSLVSLLDGKPLRREKPLFWHYYGGAGNRQVGVRDGDWKLVASWDGASGLPTGGSLRPGIVDALRKSSLATFELYNIREDIDESDDLSERPETPIDRLREFAKTTYRQVIAEGPDWPFEPAEQ